MIARELVGFTRRLHLAWNVYQEATATLLTQLGVDGAVLGAQQAALGEFRSAQMDFLTLLIDRIGDLEARLDMLEGRT